MKSMWILMLLNCLFYCAAQTPGIIIESTPSVGLDGSIQTELTKTVSLTCRHNAASEVDSELVWLRNDALVSLKEENKKGQSRVCISPVIQADRDATFTCHLQGNASERVSVVLNVTYAPLSSSENMSIEEDETMVLLCDTEANPPLSAVIWTLNGTEVDLKASGLSMTNDGFTSRLFTDSAKRSLHEGIYSCITHSPMYGQRTKEFTVEVTDKTLKFPLWPMVAGIIVVCLTTILAVAARWKKIVKCCK